MSKSFLLVLEKLATSKMAGILCLIRIAQITFKENMLGDLLGVVIANDCLIGDRTYYISLKISLLKNKTQKNEELEFLILFGNLLATMSLLFLFNHKSTQKFHYLFYNQGKFNIKGIFMTRTITKS